MGTKGQALLELAVFGTVALAALGFLIRVGMQMNYDQEIRMAAFRRALAAARSDNGTNQDALGVAYYYLLNRQMPNPTDGFMTMARSPSQASAFVEVGQRFTFAYEDEDRDGDGQPDNPNAGRQTHTRVIVRADNREQAFTQNDFPHDMTIDGGDAEINLFAFQGLVRQSDVENTGRTTVRNTETTSSLNSRTDTCTDVKVNTIAQDTVPSCIGGGAGTVVLR